MNALTILVEIVLCIAALWALTARRLWADYWPLGVFTAIHALIGALLLGLTRALHNANDRAAAHAIYPVYFYSYWIGSAAEMLLLLFFLYILFRGTVGPLKGLRRAFGAIILLSGALSLLTGYVAVHSSGQMMTISAISMLERTQSLLALGLLLFLGLAIRPLGLTYRSRVFGISLGLGILSVVSLTMLLQPHLPQNQANLVYSLAFSAAMILWTIFLILPEPPRRDLALSPTSSLLRLNAILLGEAHS